MQKKFTLLFAVVLLSVGSYAQFSVGAAGNYTMYKGSFGKSTPGFKIEAGYDVNEKVRVSLGFTKGFAIKTPSSIYSSDELGNEKVTGSEISTSFSTITLAGNYRFVGDEESTFSLYAPVGASYVMAKSSEKETEAIPAGYTAMNKMESASESGLTINLGLGTQYRFGAPAAFVEGGIALPANKVNENQVANYIPAHFTFNVGVRFTLGGGSND
jgi:hypothetical protein